MSRDRIMVSASPQSKTGFDFLALTHLSLLALLLLIYQYTHVLNNVFKGLGRYQNIPGTVIFLSLLFLIILTPDVRSLTEKWRSLIYILAVGVFLLWIFCFFWAYTRGSTISMFKGHLYFFLAIITALFYFWAIRTRPQILLLIISVFVVFVGAMFVSAYPFEDTFLPGRPLWNIQNVVHRLQNGEWIYEYGNTHTPPYYPANLLAYLPVGLAGLDLRWVNIVAVLLILLSLFYSGIKARTLYSLVGIFIFILSPVFLYHAFTVQLPIYWLILLWFIIFLIQENVSGQFRIIFIASLFRPFAWPMAVLWLVNRSIVARPPIVRIFSQRTKRLEMLWLFISKNLKPSLLEIMLFAVTIVAFFVDPKSFVWNTVVWAQGDGLQAVGTGMPQPSRSIALTPLLPYAEIPQLVFTTQILLLIAFCFVVVKSRFLIRHTAKAMVVMYILFLSFSFQVHNYYWVDVITMTIPIVLAGKVFHSVA